MPRRHSILPNAVDNDPEQVQTLVSFQWYYIGQVKLIPKDDRISLPECRRPGVYRLRGSKRNGSIDDDVWYVGQSMSSMYTRVIRHLSDRFDPATGKGKAFHDLIRHPVGYCELDEARDVTFNGNRLVGMPDGQFPTLDDMMALSAKDRQMVQFVMNAVEGTG